MSTIKPGRATDAAVARAIGVDPKIIHIVTNNEGESAAAMTDERDGPWYNERQLRQWLEKQQSEGLLCGYVMGEWKQYPHFSTVEADALAAMEATGRPWCAMKCGEEEKGWTTAAYVARITDPEMEWAEATTLCLAASAAILAWAEAKGGK